MQAEDGIRDAQESRGLGDVYKRQVILILALSQLLIDLTIIYTFVTPIAWGVGIGIGVGIAVFLAFGLKDRAPEMMNNLLNKIHK